MHLVCWCVYFASFVSKKLFWRKTVRFLFCPILWLMPTKGVSTKYSAATSANDLHVYRTNIRHQCKLSPDESRSAYSIPFSNYSPKKKYYSVRMVLMCLECENDTDNSLKNICVSLSLEMFSLSNQSQGCRFWSATNTLHSMLIMSPGTKGVATAAILRN